MILKQTVDSSTFINVGESMVNLASGPMGIAVDRTTGSYINGPLSISSPPSSVRFGGIYKFNPLTLSGLPSTIVTPIPTFILDVPAKSTAALISIGAMVASTAASII